jgi:hypothetical protein
MSQNRPPVPLTTLEAQGYTHLYWKCTACGLECARGFQLLRIRGRLGNDSSIASVARKLRCPRCFHRPSSEMGKASKDRGCTDRRCAGGLTAARLLGCFFFFLALLLVAGRIRASNHGKHESRLMRLGAIPLLPYARHKITVAGLQPVRTSPTSQSTSCGNWQTCPTCR